MRRTAPAVLVALLLLAVTASVTPAAAATAPSIDGAPVMSPAPDYATERFSNPWDYSDAADILLDAPGPAENVTGQAVTGGRLRFDAARSAHVSPLWVGFPEELPERFSGPNEPINAGRYTHLAVRAYASNRVPGAIMWFGSCRDFRNECLGGRPFTLETGWRTYVIKLENTFPGLSQPWAGLIPGLRFAVSPSSPTHFEVDWLRVYHPTGAKKINWDAGRNGGTLYWDSDADPANNTPTNPGWGVLATAKSGAQTAVFASGYPSGSYRFYTVSGGVRSPYSAPLVIDEAPLPVIDDPDFIGGEDYATRHLGDPWDMNGPADVTALGNVQNVLWTGGQLHATNGPPRQNDPFVRLRLGGAGIDATRYHRLTVRMSYEGPFGLQDAPGGGAHGRLIWWRADTGSGVFHDSREIVTWKDRRTYSVDLATNPPGAVESPTDGHQVGWVGGRVTYLRWDPNEDPGARRWYLDDVRLAADDEAAGAFDVRWHDNNPASGDVRVSLYYDTDRHNFDGKLIAADLAQRPGQNSYRWQTGGIPGGKYWVYAVATNGTSTTRTYASGPLRIYPTAAPAPAHPHARIAGSDRVGTSIALSRTAFAGTAPAAVLARADDFPDALAAAPLAAAAKGPLLLNPSAQLDARVREELVRLGVKTVYLMGGTRAQSDAVQHAAAALPGVQVVRVSGTDRYATAAEAAREAVRLWRAAGDATAGRRALVALGTSFPDALAAGPLAARARMPLLLVTPQDVPGVTRSVATELGSKEIIVVGGRGVVSDAVAKNVAPGATVARIGGPSRYDTAALAAQAAVNAGANPNVVLVAAGDTFPDALGAGPTAAALGGVLLLTHREVLVPPTREWVGARASTLTFLKVAGGRAAISDPVLDALLRAAGRA